MVYNEKNGNIREPAYNLNIRSRVLIPAILMLRIVFITAIINIIAVLPILLSCRCINIWKMTSGLNRFPWFKRFFKWHCYFWYIFIPSVIIHAIFALMSMGIPF